VTATRSSAPSAFIFASARAVVFAVVGSAIEVRKPVQAVPVPPRFRKTRRLPPSLPRTTSARPSPSTSPVVTALVALPVTRATPLAKPCQVLPVTPLFRW
jgi:hypothetical protein